MVEYDKIIEYLDGFVQREGSFTTIGADTEEKAAQLSEDLTNKYPDYYFPYEPLLFEGWLVKVYKRSDINMLKRRACE